MKNNVYTVRDNKAEAYLTPFFMRSDGEAKRALIASSEDIKSNFNKYPEDFSLWKLGEYEDTNGSLIPMKTNLCLGNIVDIKSEFNKN